MPALTIREAAQWSSCPVEVDPGVVSRREFVETLRMLSSLIDMKYVGSSVFKAH